MTVSLWTTLVLLAAGALAGAVGSAGGITSLISYPALLAVGEPALVANVANLVAVVACWPGAAVASRCELAGTGRWLARGLPVAGAGGALGAWLVRSTSPGVFSRLVPALVLLGSLALLAQPWLTAHRSSSAQTGRQLALAGIAVLSVYGGYFGASSGVMMLVLSLVLLDPSLPRANAIKNMVIGGTAVASAAVFTLTGPVDWRAVVPLAAGMLAGSTAGPVVARRVAPGRLRWVFAGLGLVLAVRLWVHPA